jgi:hypothetical protein
VAFGLHFGLRQIGDRLAAAICDGNDNGEEKKRLAG